MSSHRILIAEEDRATRAFLAEQLAADGYEVLVAENRRHALVLLAIAGPALVLADVNGETMGLLDAVRSGSGLAGEVDPDAPMIVLTHRADELTRVRVRAADGAAKHRIGQLAASLVNPGRTVVFDVGTTVLAAARALPANFSGVAVTCSLVAAAELATRPEVQVLIAGGRVRPGDLAVSNAHTVAFFEEIHADVAFLGSGCVSADDGLTDFYVDEIATRRVLIANSATTYVLADSSKLGKVAPHRVCGVDEVTAFITDQAPPEQMEAAFRTAAGRVLYPPGDHTSG